MAKELVTRNFGFSLSRVRLHASWLAATSASHDTDGFGLYDIEIVDGRIGSIVPLTTTS